MKEILDFFGKVCYNRIIKGRGKPETNPHVKGGKYVKMG